RRVGADAGEGAGEGDELGRLLVGGALATLIAMIAAAVWTERSLPLEQLGLFDPSRWARYGDGAIVLRHPITTLLIGSVTVGLGAAAVAALVAGVWALHRGLGWWPLGALVRPVLLVAGSVP